MRVLLDQNCPERIGQNLVGHEAVPARLLGWDRLTNGDLLAAAEAAGFDLLLTADQSIRYQQNLGGRQIAIVLLSLNKLVSLITHFDLVQTAIDQAKPGSYDEVTIPRPKLARRPRPNTEP